MDIFAPGYKKNGCFIVQNISPQIKTINIFNYPINYQCQRDLLQIPGVAEGDIRASLLKGELNYKIRAGDIEVICSDIDLLQFNDSQRVFLENSGIVNGLQVTSDQMAVLEQQDIELVGLVNGINTIFTIPSGIWIQSSPYKIIVYLNGVKQVLGDDYFIAESGGPGSGYDTVIMTVPPESSILPPDIVTADYYVNNS
jgi:hypothetical protein